MPRTERRECRTIALSDKAWSAVDSLAGEKRLCSAAVERIVLWYLGEKREGRITEDALRPDFAVGEHLRRRRAVAGMSIRDLEAASGVRAATICALESGKVTHPRASTLSRLEAALETSFPATRDDGRRGSLLLGSELSRRRRKCRLTREELCRKADISLTALRALERPVSQDALERILQVLQVSESRAAAPLPSGVEIARRRRACGLRQSDLAKLVGLEPPTVSRIETDPEYRARRQVLERIAQALDDAQDSPRPPVRNADVLRLRKKHKMTQTQLALLVGVTPGVIHRIETDLGYRPRRPLIERIADVVRQLEAGLSPGPPGRDKSRVDVSPDGQEIARRRDRCRLTLAEVARRSQVDKRIVAAIENRPGYLPRREMLERVLRVIGEAEEQPVIAERGENLARWRKQHQITQAQLATLAGVTTHLVYRLEMQPTYHPSRRVLERITQARRAVETATIPRSDDP